MATLAETLLSSPPYRIEFPDEWDFRMNKDSITATRKFLALGDHMGAAHPHYGEGHPLNPDCRCVSVGIEPLKISTTHKLTQSGYELGGAINDYVIINAYYSTDFLDIGDAPKKSVRLASGYINSGLESHWASDDLSTGQQLAYPQSQHEIVYHRKFEWADWNLYVAAIGEMTPSINSLAFTCPYDGTVYPAGTLLFEGASVESECRLVDGLPYWVADCYFKLTWVPDGVMKGWRQDTAQWDTVKELNSIMKSRDFTNLMLGA